ncbi:hypothetical protein COEREDRAFT_83471, partial [Coemansia reversa NRRL 1564]
QYSYTSPYASLVSIHSQQMTAYLSIGQDTRQAKTEYHIIKYYIIVAIDDIVSI